MLIKRIFKDYQKLIGTELTVNGWVKTCRDQKQMMFIHLSDGSSQQTLQVVVSADVVPNMAELSKITTGTSLCVKGTLSESPAKGQPFELKANMVKIYQICDQSFPLQKVGLPMEFMRGLPHLRHRSNIMRACFVVKSEIMNAIHRYFTGEDYVIVDIPVITTNACEGGCQPLQVTSLIDDGKISSVPVKKVFFSQDPPLALMTEAYATEIDFSKDFFDNKVYLTVSNQLHLECFAHGMGRVYTITPATRGEPSQSTKHLAHFNMLEAEFCFGELSDNINLAESCIKYCVQQAMEKCQEEMNILDKATNGALKTKLDKIMNEPFVRIEHQDAITLLATAHEKEPFLDMPAYDGDLTGEHERFLVKHFNQPVIVMRYPKTVKAFYMPVHHQAEIDGKTIEYVDCFDLLMDIGEVVGGSQRIWAEQDLVSRMMELGIDPKHLDWYIDLRKYGSVPHGGFGLGIERLTAVITGMANVKDCISFPITVHHCKF